MKIRGEFRDFLFAIASFILVIFVCTVAKLIELQ